MLEDQLDKKVQIMNSPFKGILHTNTVPSDEDLQRIHDLLKEPRKEAAALSVEIERLRALIHQLIQKRDDLEGFIHAHEALTSPARRLPADIIAEIFTACMPSNRNAIMSTAEAPLLLCRVCRAWRDVALSTPRLWASLHIVAHSDHGETGPDSKLRKVIKAIDSWLSRSGVLPLSISLVRSWTAKEVDFRPFLETLVPYSSRWNRIRFELETSFSFEPMGALSPSDVPSLEVASIDGFETLDEEVDWRTVSFLGTPSLRSLLLRHMASSFLAFPVPWNQLRHLSFGEKLTAAQALEMLRQCPNLETCFLNLNNSLVSASGLHPVRMDHLRRLCLSFLYLGRGAPRTDLLEYLDVPNLKCLEYAADDVAEFSLKSLLTTLKCLECLRLRIENEHATESVIGCLRLVPTLRELAFCYDTALGKDFWTSMTPTVDDKPIVCPQLQIMKFRWFTVTSDNEVLEFIQARNGSHSSNIARLSKVHMQFNRRREIDIVSALQPNIVEGLDFSMHYGYSPSEDRESHTIGGEVSSQWWASDDY
ncbi:hypothetical protein MSAN_00028100 [Mycena sanguinolenta]|uniref:F-box domain-containing protein n=1 Tax=Mycena sanguinolenta TaxID=230812 RepID=A0A8H6ZEW1_9AGAR|nr:hypothetical protein MSAN_00028100 [Mycena sanguinolenta]